MSFAAADSLLFRCPVCRTRLRDPVTLSCGYTVCKHCLSSHSSSPPSPSPPPRPHQQAFECPVQDCQLRAHLFDLDRKVSVDAVIDAMLATRYGSSSSCGQKRRFNETTNHRALLECPKCGNTFSDPITTHCGHVFCKVCLLELAIQGKACIRCSHPLPSFNQLQAQIAANRILTDLLLIEQFKPSSPSTVVSSSSVSIIRQQQQPMSVFVTGLVILPRQHARLPVYTPAHIRMLREAAFGDRKSGKVYLAAVHRGRPSLARYGTLVEIMSLEPLSPQRSPDAGMVLDVVGCERYEAASGDADPHQSSDLSVLTAFCTPIAADTTPSDDCVEEIRRFLIETAQHPPPALAWGPLWFDTMERIHGPLPSQSSPAEDVLWWAAIVLPVSDTERYSLLCIVPLRARLSLVLSWTRQLRSQWGHQKRK